MRYLKLDYEQVYLYLLLFPFVNSEKLFQTLKNDYEKMSVKDTFSHIIIKYL